MAAKRRGRNTFACIARLVDSHPLGITALALAIIVAGLGASIRLPFDWIPQIEFAEVSIEAAWPGASSLAVEQQVTSPIEREIQRIRGTTNVDSTSSPGRARITATIADHIDHKIYLATLADSLANLQGKLPTGIVPRLRQTSFAQRRGTNETIVLALIAQTSTTVLTQWVDTKILPSLRAVPGVGVVTVHGGANPEMTIELAETTPDRLAVDVERTLRDRIVPKRLGTLQATDRRTLLLAANLETAEDITRLPVRTDSALTSFETIGSVTTAPPVPRSHRRIDGRPALLLRVERQPGTRLPTVSRALREAVVKINRQLPAGMSLCIVEDPSQAIREALHDLAGRAVAGLAFLGLVLMIALRRMAALGAVVFASFAPIGLAFLMLESIDLLVLAGLVLLIGLLVDNGIVVVEEVLERASRIRSDRPARRRQVVAEALSSVWPPLLGGTLTSAAVFFPFVFLHGELRQILGGFSKLAAITLVASLGAAMIIAPVFVRRPGPRRGRRRTIAARIWAKLAGVAALRPRIMLTGIVLLIGLPPFWLPDRIEPTPIDPPWVRTAGAHYDRIAATPWVAKLRKDLDRPLGGLVGLFLDRVELGEPWIVFRPTTLRTSVELPAGTRASATLDVLTPFETVALDQPGVERVTLAVDERRGDLTVRFADDNEATLANAAALSQRMVNHATRLSGMKLSVTGAGQQGYFSGYGSAFTPFRFEARGPALGRLGELVDRAARQFAALPGVGSVSTADSGWHDDELRVLRLRWDAEHVLRFRGASARELIAHLEPRLAHGATLGQISTGTLAGTSVRLVNRGHSALSVEDRPVVTDDGVIIPVGDLIDEQREHEQAVIERRSQRYRRVLSIYFGGPTDIGAELIERAWRTMTWPPGYSLVPASYDQSTDERRSTLVFWGLGAIVVVWLCCAAILDSWRLAFVSMVSLPLAAVGAASAFVLTDAPFTEGAFLGVILLAGIAMNDSLLLTFRYRQLLRRRPTLTSQQAAQAAMRRRFLPIWTTTATSVAGLLPLLLYRNGDVFWYGLALTVIGGLLASTLFAPATITALLSLRDARRT
ncbi:MAG: efflux RND transporter permease subunit [Acidobacteriota bacterium]